MMRIRTHLKGCFPPLITKFISKMLKKSVTLIGFRLVRSPKDITMKNRDIKWD
jgi:hypothetical protein